VLPSFPHEIFCRFRDLTFLPTTTPSCTNSPLVSSAAFALTPCPAKEILVKQGLLAVALSVGLILALLFQHRPAPMMSLAKDAKLSMYFSQRVDGLRAAGCCELR